MKEEIQAIIIDTVNDLNEELENENLVNPTSLTKLYGGDGALDSLALVSLITDIEETISEKFNKDIVLADERAMSARTSPFRSIESLSNYIEQLLNEE